MRAPREYLRRRECRTGCTFEDEAQVFPQLDQLLLVVEWAVRPPEGRFGDAVYDGLERVAELAGFSPPAW